MLLLLALSVTFSVVPDQPEYIFDVAFRGDSPLLTRFTPLEGLLSPCFRVIDTQTLQALPYRGPVAKRVPLEKSPVVALHPEKAVVRRVDLSLLFQLEGGRQYEVHFNSEHLFVRSPRVERLHPSRVRAAPWRIRVKRSTEPTHRRRRRVFSTSGCSPSQQQTFPRTLELATLGTQRSIEYLASCDGFPYVDLFGQVEAQRKAVVENHFLYVRSRLQAQDFVLDCADRECDAGTYAFVYLDEPGEINLCGAYWTASPQLEYNSQPGTIIHELTHHNRNGILGHAEDHAYGITKCRALATTNPLQAVNNADSIEYFAELGPYPCVFLPTVRPTPAPPTAPPTPAPTEPLVCPTLDLGRSLEQVRVQFPEGPKRYTFSCVSQNEGTEQSFALNITADGVYSFNTLGSTFDTILELRTDSCFGPVRGCSDDEGALRTSRISNVPLVSGQRVYIWVGGYWAYSTGSLVLTISRGQPTGAPQPTTAPGCFDRDLGSDYGEWTFTTLDRPSRVTPTCGRSSVSSPPEHIFLWRAPTGGSVEVSTIGSSFDTVLQIEEAQSECVGRDPICVDDAQASVLTYSVINFTPTAGTLYRIIVDGYFDYSWGAGKLLIQSTAPSGQGCRSCYFDYNDDGQVDVVDIAALIVQFGTCPADKK